MIAFLISFFSLSIIILLHEAGHFLLARRFGVKVEEFGFGYPPRFFSIKKKGIIYSLNIIPFGGFLKILEDNGVHSFKVQSLSKRALILLAGVSTNLLLAFFIFTALFYFGMPTAVLPKTYKQNISVSVEIEKVEKNSPAFFANLQVGDIIKGIEYLDNYYQIESVQDVQNKTAELQGKDIILVIQRQGEKIKIPVSLRTLSEEEREKKGYLGVLLNEKGIVKYSLLKSPIKSIWFMGMITKEVLISIKGVFINIFKHANIKGLTGPIGVMVITTKGFESGLNYGIYTLGIISYAFGVFNLLPIPAIDGGRLFFLVIEKIRRRSIPKQIENLINNICFSLLIILLFLVTIQDFNFFILNK